MNHTQIIEAWVAQASTASTGRMIGNRRYNNVFADGDRLYSYGYHFELARILRGKRGVSLLLNGDNFSVTTSSHQSQLRTVVGKSGLPSVIIPYSALNAAGIDISTVEIVESLEDTWVDHGVRKSKDRPESSGLWWYDLVAATVKWGDNLYRERPNLRVRRSPILGLKGYKSFHYSKTFEEKYGPIGAEIVEWECRVRSHQLGEALIRATYLTQTDKKVRALFLSGFDVQETRPLYFFCQMPKSARNCKTVAEAYEALKPDLVLEAERAGRTVFRQGDIFAAETLADKRGLRKRGATFEKRGNLLGTNHEATEVARLGNLTYARGVLWHRPAGRQADHKRVPMGDQKSWFLVAKNTVPVSK